MKNRNWMLIIGGLLIGFILIIMLFPAFFTKVNPYGAQYIKQAIPSATSTLNVKAPPFPPSKEYPFGSDLLGRDIYSLIIYGTRLTMLLGFSVVIGRFLLSLPLGLAAGFGNKPCKIIIKQFSTVFSSIPILIISLMILNMTFFSSLYKKESVIAFATVLTIVGFGKLAQLIEERVEGIIAQPFIRSEVAIGKSKGRIAVENVIPHLAPELVIFFFMELGVALLLIMQLGVFNIFVGALRIMDGDGISNTMLPISFEPEWASMLGAAKNSILSSPWMVFYPALAFFISIFAFNTFAEGLRKQLQKRNSRFIPYLRKAISFEAKDFKLSNLNPIKGKFRLLSIILIIVFTYTIILNVSNIKYNFNSKDISIGTSYNEVVVGSKEAEATANLIAKEFKNNGYKPLSSEGFITPYEIKDEYYCYSGNATLEDSKNTYSLNLGKDFSPASFDDHDFDGEVLDTTSLDMLSIDNYSKFDNKIILLNGNIYSKSAMLHISNEIIKNSKAKGILLSIKSGDKLPVVFGSDTFNYPLLWITQNTLNKIDAFSGKLSVSIRCKKLTGNGRNIIGILPGYDNKLMDQAIMLGFDYNYLKTNKKLGIEKIKFSIEFLRKLASLRRDRPVIVAFWDGTLNDQYNGKFFYSNNPLYETSKVEAYIDLTKLRVEKSSFVEFNSDLSPSTRYMAWELAHNLRVDFEKKTKVVNYDNIRDVYEALASTPNDDEVIYYKGMMPVTIVANEESKIVKPNDGVMTIDDIGYVVLKAIQENTY